MMVRAIYVKYIITAIEVYIHTIHSGLGLGLGLTLEMSLCRDFSIWIVNTRLFKPPISITQ